MLVEINNFRAICHGNKIKYSSHPDMHITPKAGQCNHDCRVPLLYDHKHDDPNAVIGYAMLKWCPDTCEIHAECHLDDNGKKCLEKGKLYSLDVYITRVKYTHAGNIRDYKIREVSIVPHEVLPEHEEIIFMFLEGPALRPKAEIKYSEGCDGRDAHYYISYSCPTCGEHLYRGDYKCEKCNTLIDWSKQACIAYTRYIEWR